MSGTESIRTATLDQRVVLLAVAEAAAEGATPANPAELRAICNERLAQEGAPVFGGLSEADTTRALYSLEEEGLVVNEGPASTSPTGKGRPLYAPVPDAETIYEALDEDEELAPIYETLQHA
jgi:hypothetical protein